MATKKTTGFQSGFINPNQKTLEVKLPKLTAIQQKDIATVKGNKEGLLNYIHFSLVMSAKRKFCYFTASNVDGIKFKSIGRKTLFPPSGTDKWIEDDSVKGFQWGAKLYGAIKSDFDKGHMTRREDPQWGDTQKTAFDAALSTFHFTNAVPQHKNLNRIVWGNLEDYILHTECEKNNLKVIVITGPVLKDEDPFFVTEIGGEKVQLPTLFWKIVYYTNDGKKLNRVAFLMGQRNLLLKNRIIEKATSKGLVPPAEKAFFTDYEDKEIFQVNIDTVEMLTGLQFQKANDTFTDNRQLKLVVEEVQAKAFGGGEENEEPKYRFLNLVGSK